MIALTHIIITKVQYTLPTEIKLNKNQLATKITFDVLQYSTIIMANMVEAEDGNKLVADYATTRSFNNTTTEAAMDDTDDKVMKPIVNKMNTWLPILTIDLGHQLLISRNGCLPPPKFALNFFFVKRVLG